MFWEKYFFDIVLSHPKHQITFHYSQKAIVVIICSYNNIFNYIRVDDIFKLHFKLN